LPKGDAMPDFIPYKNHAEIAEVVQNFEGCLYAKDEFPHFRHLAVAAWYLSHMTPQESLDRMRRGLLTFTRHHGVNAYHETITQFWLCVTEKFLQDRPQSEPLPDRLNALIHEFARKDVLFEYYSRERVLSDEARERWVAPDLRNFKD
jgi:hypothetical protein